jgi:hypothetical protein
MAAWPRSNDERTMSLKAKLNAFRSEFMAHVRPEVGDATNHYVTPRSRAPLCGRLLEERKTSCKHFPITTSMLTAASS